LRKIAQKRLAQICANFAQSLAYIVNNFAKLYVRFTPILRELYVAHVKFT
jgi:hypothetical protein